MPQFDRDHHRPAQRTGEAMPPADDRRFDKHGREFVWKHLSQK
ncbi:MAG: hypothetical protein OJF47_003155 [Nitrospira sp.]|nr:MAG: hypothetical protein OJF47_003155 [Nitrospira sp.]